VYGDARNTMAGVLPLSKEEQKKKAKLDKGFTGLSSEIFVFLARIDLRRPLTQALQQTRRRI
jgi:hypothetical protein